MPAPRLEDERLLTGRGRYVADLRLPRMVEASFVRSRVAHGRIVRIDTSAASAARGVVAVATAGDLDGVSPVPHFCALARPVGIFPLCRERVRYVGAPLAVVVAGSHRGAAGDADEAVFFGRRVHTDEDEPAARRSNRRDHQSLACRESARP